MDASSTFKIADLDKLHALEIKGSGIKIGIVDTGVNYYYPSLGGDFGPGFKIAGGYTFVDDNWEGVSRDLILGSGFLMTCFDSGHGTHVSGIVGILNPPHIGFGMTGVAPEASIYVYKVFSCISDSAMDDLIMASMMQAAADGANAISLSLGGVDPFQNHSPYTTLVNSLVRQGIAVIAVNGQAA